VGTETVRTVVDDEAADRRREQRGWYFYDWACSVYSTSVLTVFLGPYLTSVAEEAADAEGFVHPLGIPVRAGSFFAYSVSLSVIVAVLVMPLVGAAADRTGRKKPLLGAAAYVGAGATAGMFFLAGDRYLLGGVLLIVANAAQSVAMMLYNSYLPQIAPPEERDAVSSRGWAFGYAAGALVLVANLVLYLAHDSFGLSEGMAVRICLASAGLWWGGFALIPLRRLRDRRTRAGEATSHAGEATSRAGEATTTAGDTAAPAREATAPGLRRLAATVRDMRRHPLTLGFLLAYLVYNDGIQTVISQASVYGSKELDLGQSTLIGAVRSCWCRCSRWRARWRWDGSRGPTGRSAPSSVRWPPGRRSWPRGTSCPRGSRCGSSCWPRASAWSSAAARPCRARCSPTSCRPARRPNTSRRTR
jgi:UMF1 family MFS transporter